MATGAAAVFLIRREVDEQSLSWALFVRFFSLFNKFVARWDSLPTFLAVLNLIAVRARLREKNLHSVSGIPVTNASGVRSFPKEKPEFLVERQADGLYNDLDKPEMGCSSANQTGALDPSDFDKSHPGARFGRNVPLSEARPEIDAPLLEPNPRLVSNFLLARPIENGAPKVTPATSLNLLAGAWIQFQTHDWFNHGTPRSIDDDPFEVDVDPQDWPGGKMQVRRTRADPTRDQNCVSAAEPPTYVSAETHWWDASQIYGGGAALQQAYRTGTDGKLKIYPNTYRLPIEGEAIAALPSSWWVGLGLMHVLFTLEHNAICDYLHQQYPEWREMKDGGDEQFFRIARLINSALMAKIHTVEWTPAILDHPALQFIMHGSWWGAAQEFITRNLGRISEGEIISGIPGSPKDHFGVDYSLTEEFVSVYRMHPLLPEALKLRRCEDDQQIHELKFVGEDFDDPDLATGPKAMSNASDHASFADIFYTFGMEHPGALQLGNYPNWMRRMRRSHGAQQEEFIDLAAIDILRDRERGVPRYNRFRELFHMPRKSFEEMSDDPTIVKTLREVYGDPDKVDLMVGLYAETPPVGFGFSDTAFRVFILMAGRRLKSDRLFTDDYRPEIYTQAGLDWINDNSMISVLLRHFPELAPALRGVDNAFAPWSKKRTDA
ncbi:peroxidase [Methylocystis sp. MitZ-2018]|nr:peroxidase [Methylocystis sp. MitZ-2018]